jgi:hypothetical protein
VERFKGFGEGGRGTHACTRHRTLTLSHESRSPEGGAGDNVVDGGPHEANVLRVGRAGKMGVHGLLVGRPIQLYKPLRDVVCGSVVVVSPCICVYEQWHVHPRGGTCSTHPCSLGSTS